jgi:hypothetical protein
MKVKYKETSRGGLAVNVIDALRKRALTCSFESFGAVRAFPACTAKSPWELPRKELKVPENSLADERLTRVFKPLLGCARSLETSATVRGSRAHRCPGS